MGHPIPAGHTIALCTFRVQRGREARFEELLAHHAPTLRRLGLLADEPSQAFRGLEDDGSPFYFELLPWKSAGSVELAHGHPEVMALWEPMGACCEPRGGRPPMEFPHAERLHGLRTPAR